jgi:hypothetical protein
LPLHLHNLKDRQRGFAIQILATIVRLFGAIAWQMT